MSPKEIPGSNFHGDRTTNAPFTAKCPHCGARRTVYQNGKNPAGLKSILASIKIRKITCLHCGKQFALKKIAR